MPFTAPTDRMLFLLRHGAGLDALLADGLFPDADLDTLGAVLRTAGDFAADRLAPLNRDGDRIGARLIEGRVIHPPGWVEMFADWRAGGWTGICAPAAAGGMGLPLMIGTAVMELWTAANMGFATGPVLTQGAIDALVHHADDALKAAWLPNLINGTWTACMALTESQAGSDLGALRTKAVPGADGTYAVSGAKIFITYAEHELAANIVHLVLARLPDAPPGSRGISLFLVPKILPDGQRNGIVCTGIEHKTGIHASPTCAVAYDGAVGWLVGAPHKGLACMFTMMNRARLATGLQGVAIAEAATQQARAYARDRVQGGGPIIQHPDVKRNLLSMAALTEAGRLIAYRAAAAIDRAETATDPAIRARYEALAGFLTPITKACCSEIGVEVASLGIQIHGGMGYVEETGAAQYWRDARIAPIYEGTNGIQGIDLVQRKLLRDGGATAQAVIADLAAELAAFEGTGGVLGGSAAALKPALAALAETTGWLRDPARSEAQRLAAATPYLRLWGVVCGGIWLLSAAAKAAARGEACVADLPALARFHAFNLAPHAFAHAAAARAGAESVLVDADLLAGG